MMCSSRADEDLVVLATSFPLQTLADLHHPAILHVFDAGNEIKFP